MDCRDGNATVSDTCVPTKSDLFLAGCTPVVVRVATDEPGV